MISRCISTAHLDFVGRLVRRLDDVIRCLSIFAVPIQHLVLFWSCSLFWVRLCPSDFGDVAHLSAGGVRPDAKGAVSFGIVAMVNLAAGRRGGRG